MLQPYCKQNSETDLLMFEHVQKYFFAFIKVPEQRCTLSFRGID